MVYDKIDTIKVRPQAGMARVGGINFPSSCSSSKRSRTQRRRRQAGHEGRSGARAGRRRRGASRSTPRRSTTMT